MSNEKSIKEKKDEQITIPMTPSLKRQFRIKCIENGERMSSVIQNFVKEYVEQ